MAAKWWTVGQLCRRWADQDGPMPRTTVYSFISRGKLRAKKFGGRLRVHQSEVDRFEQGTPDTLAAEQRRGAVLAARGVSPGDEFGF